MPPTVNSRAHTLIAPGCRAEERKRHGLADLARDYPSVVQSLTAKGDHVALTLNPDATWGDLAVIADRLRAIDATSAYAEDTGAIFTASVGDVTAALANVAQHATRGRIATPGASLRNAVGDAALEVLLFTAALQDRPTLDAALAAYEHFDAPGEGPINAATELLAMFTDASLAGRYERQGDAAQAMYAAARILVRAERLAGLGVRAHVRARLEDASHSGMSGGWYA